MSPGDSKSAVDIRYDNIAATVGHHFPDGNSIEIQEEGAGRWQAVANEVKAAAQFSIINDLRLDENVTMHLRRDYGSDGRR